MIWVMLHPQMTPEALGFIPDFLSEYDPRPAAEQFQANYVWGGWRPDGVGRNFERDPATETLTYPGDPPYKPLAMTKLRDETIYVYQSAWVSIVQPDGSHEVSRLD